MKNIGLASGQIVLLRALEFSKPVITNFSREALKDWLGVDGKSGILLYNTFDQLKELVSMLLKKDLLQVHSKISNKILIQNSYEEWTDKLVALFD